jgi:LEA14-like dessication related protein
MMPGLSDGRGRGIIGIELEEQTAMTSKTATRLGQQLAVALLLVTTGCATVNEILSRTGVDKPTARVRGARLTGLSLRSVDLAFDIEVTNPLAVAVPLDRLEYSLAGSGQPILSGAADLEGSVPARGTQLVNLPVRVDCLALVRTGSGFRPGQVVDYSADLTLQVDIPTASPLRIPLRTQGELPIPKAPAVEVSSIGWQELTLSRARGTATLDVTNTNDFLIGLDSFDYALSIGGVQVATGTTPSAQTFEAGASGGLTIPIDVRPIDLGTALFDILRGSRASYGIEGTFRVGTPFGPLDLPFGGSGETPMQR